MTRPEDLRRGEEELESLLSLDQLPDGADLESRELFQFIHACREASSAPEDTGDLVARSLSVSTREDLSWRGDARDLSRFVRDRLRSSPMLRLAAASLLLHLAAVPVVALYILTEEPPVPEFRVEVGERSAPFDDMREDEPDSGLDITEPSEASELLVDNSIRWARYHLELSQRRSGELSEVTPAWLTERLQVLYGLKARGGGGLGCPIPATALQLELRLDQHLVGPRRASFTEEDLALVELVASSFDPQAPATAWLIASSLARAESYGLSTNQGSASLAAARTLLPVDDIRRPLIEVQGDVRAMMPIDPLWLGAVREFEASCVLDSLIDHFRSIGPASPR